MDIIAGLGLFGYALLNSSNNTELKDSELKKNTMYTINDYETHFLNNYTVDFLRSDLNKINNKLNIDYKESIKPNSKIVNDNWRNETYYDKNKKKQINNLLTNDIGMIKNKNYLVDNKIETMNNIDDGQSDSIFSDDYQSFDNKVPRKDDYNSENQTSNQSDDDINTNINMNMLKTQERFMDDIVSDYSRSDDMSMDAKERKYKKQYVQQNKTCNVNFMNSPEKRCNNQFLNQFDQLKFEHNGLPEGFNNVKPSINIWNREKPIQQSPQTNFNANEDGRYGVTSEMTHGNMQPSFKAKSYGFDPEMDKKKTEIYTRNVELFTGSDQNLQFKHKQEVKRLFDPETNKVESITGTPNFSNFFESRYIPSDKRQGERPFEPIRVTPGLNLGYNQMGTTGRQDLYRVLPKSVDQLRVVTKPKVSYSQPVIPGQKGERRGIIGDLIQKTPDRFFYQTPDSMMPNTGPLEAPAIYGKYLAPQTNRAIDSGTVHLNPAKGETEKSAPQYLREGHLTAPSKISYLHAGPRNMEYNTKGQNVTKESFNNVQTQRSTTGGIVHLVGTAGNRTNDYLVNHENMTPDTTLRDLTTEQKQQLNIKGNYTSVPLINFLNYVPEVTLKQILLEDNGRKNLSNVSNSLKGYLFNSINSIRDPTLKDLISDKIKIVNQKGNYENGYLFNAQNATPDQNMRNVSQDNVIITTISNAEKGYLFNNMNAIADPTLRQLVNTLWGSGGLNFNGNYKTNQAFNYKNAIPETTLRELTENLINLTNITGPSGQIKGYLLNYINSIPDTTLRELTHDKIVLSNINPLQMKDYLINYINAVPDTTLKEITENKKYLIGQKGNYENNYIFNYQNGIPDNTLRNLISEVVHITNMDGNHKTGYLINYINAIPDDTLRQMTENKTQLLNISPIQMKNYMINYLNSIPDITLRELTENQKYLVGQHGNKGSQFAFNYENGIPTTTTRETTENQTKLIGQHGNKGSQYAFNYENGIPETTTREITENQKILIGQHGNKGSQYAFNYENGIPKTTTRQITENQKNLIGQHGNKNSQYAFNYENGIPDITLRETTEKQKNIIGQKGNRESQIAFNYENGIPEQTNRIMSENTKNITGQHGQYTYKEYAFNYENGIPDQTYRSMTENTKNITGQQGQYEYKEYAFNYENNIPDQTNRTMTEKTKNIIGSIGNKQQQRARMDVGNALLNTEKEVIAEGRDPVPVKDNRGPTPYFTEYVFCSDDPKPQKPMYAGNMPLTTIKNELFFG